MKKTLLLLATALLASCGAVTPTTPTSDTQPATTASIPIPSLSFSEVSDAENLQSGMYLHSKLVYDLNKADKKLTCYDFEMDYNKLKNKNGTKVFEVSINFVAFGENGNAAHYTVEGSEYFLYVGSAGKITEAKVVIEENRVTYLASYLSAMPTFIEPTYGSYVSNQEFTQDKVDEKGERIPNGDGGFVKEKFYLFLDLSATSAKLFVGEDNKTHREAPLHMIDNYALTYNAGGLSIKIPHVGGEFACSLTVTAANTIRFNNSSEKHGDYSAAGTFVFIEK